jgi:hypothetical protein
MYKEAVTNSPRKWWAPENITNLCARPNNNITGFRGFANVDFFWGQPTFKDMKICQITYCYSPYVEIFFVDMILATVY